MPTAKYRLSSPDIFDPITGEFGDSISVYSDEDLARRVNLMKSAGMRYHVTALDMDEYRDHRPTDADDYGQDFEAQAHVIGEPRPQWDELGAFGEVLEHWTRRGGPTADEKTAFWMSWSRLTIAWTLGMAAALIGAGSLSGLAGDVFLLVAIYDGLALVWQVVDAVRFTAEGRRWRS